MRFYNVGQIKPDKNKIDCKMKEGDECIKSWITGKWSFTDSLITPLGPVFDERWEEFTENKKLDIHCFHHVELKNTTAFSISMRNVKQFTAQFCNNPDAYEQSPCYWIAIGATDNM
ncbi:hypothetical protein DMN91_005764 [Ooceraea biroi]|uniref:Uncharacterized protein n=1 Tax=Ooceraea biroi TaxID=2015173 RepID=A0A3L8DLY3_OOCBI|nr:hypothetical protein DMN91_005764 [Ooceraea biroi]